uniref:Uncharacterized protein TCIL3000_8_7870 n=1 Tax=Trypanosoma congolense (strain IL3000) TaxID=1068625 RepID=G0UT44_TRYCI|nr:unnamed protein product [Trypanosoma congolense IL3000]
MKSRGFSQQQSHDSCEVRSSSPLHLARWNVCGTSGYHNVNDNDEEEPNKWWRAGEEDVYVRGGTTLNVHIRDKKRWRPGAAGQLSHQHHNQQRMASPNAVNVPLFMDDEDEDEDDTNSVNANSNSNVTVDGSGVWHCSGAVGGRQENWFDHCGRYNSVSTNGNDTSKNNYKNSCVYTTNSRTNYSNSSDHNSHSYITYSRSTVTGDVEKEEEIREKMSSVTMVPAYGGVVNQSHTRGGGSGAPLPRATGPVYTASRVRYNNSNGNVSAGLVCSVVVGSQGTAVTHSAGGYSAPPARNVSAASSTTATAPASTSTTGFEAAAANIIAAAGLPLGITSLSSYIMEGQLRLPARQSRHSAQSDSRCREAPPPPLRNGPISPPLSSPLQSPYTLVHNTAHMNSAGSPWTHTNVSIRSSRQWSPEINPMGTQMPTQPPPPMVGVVGTGSQQCHYQQQRQQSKAYSEYLSDLLYFHADFFPPPPPPRGLAFLSDASQASAPHLNSSEHTRRAALWYHYARKWNITHRLPPPPRTPLPELQEQTDTALLRAPYDVSGWMKMCERWFHAAQQQFDYPVENVSLCLSPGFILQHVAQC